MSTKDNFDFLRLVAAFSVLVSHTRPLHDNTFPLGILGAAAVYTFFAMSGYLVSGSWERDPHLGRFFARRILRVFPGLAIVILIAALLIGPLLTTNSLQEYFNDPRFASYCRSMLLFPAYTVTLPGVFENNPYKNTVNGSLWTLPMEIFMYATLGLLGSLGLLHKKVVLPLLALAIALCLSLALQHPRDLFLTMDENELVTCACCFFGGMFMWYGKDYLPTWRWAWIPVLLSAVFLSTSPYLPVVLLLGVPYAAISFAKASTPILRRSGRFGDFSYGIYIYAFLIQQTIIAVIPSIDVTIYFISTSFITVFAAFLSWHIIEKPANSLKKFLPTSSQFSALKRPSSV